MAPVSQNALESLLRPLRAVETSMAMQRLLFLVLKNLADLLACADSTAERALALYAEALQLDREDIVLWNRCGTLVRLHISSLYLSNTTGAIKLLHAYTHRPLNWAAGPGPGTSSSSGCATTQATSSC